MTDRLPDDSIDLPTVLDHMRSTVEQCDDDYRRRWGPEEEHQLFRDIAEAFPPSLASLEISSELVARIRTLYDEVGTPFGGLQNVAEFVQTLTAHPIVRERLEIRYAYEAVALLKGLHARLDVLLELMVERQLTPAADAFLRKATRLFLWGFEEETIVMCAAALEAAYQARFSDDEMVRLAIRKRDPSSSFSIGQYVNAAVRLGVFTVQQARLADELRSARNKSVHGPNALADARNELTAGRAVRGTAELLGELFPATQ